MKLLAIGAHPDDIEIFMYGFIAVCKKRGDDVFLAVASDGAAGGEEKGELLVNKRKNETTKGLSNLGGPIFLDLPDGKLTSNNIALSRINQLISEIKPDLILTHPKEDYHPDHRALSYYIKQSAGFTYPIIYCDTLMGVNFIPEIYVDISEHFEEKKNAILKHKTQNPENFYRVAKLMNRYRSAQCNGPDGTYAEAYRVEKTFPFTDLRRLIPPAPKFKHFFKPNSGGFV